MINYDKILGKVVVINHSTNDDFLQEHEVRSVCLENFTFTSVNGKEYYLNSILGVFDNPFDCRLKALKDLYQVYKKRNAKRKAELSRMKNAILSLAGDFKDD